MGLDFKKIYKAWIIANNPTETQLLTAEARQSICNTCPSRKKITDNFKIGIVCGECGCPISKKIFSPTFNDCPLKKWKEVDEKFGMVEKNKKTII